MATKNMNLSSRILIQNEENTASEENEIPVTESNGETALGESMENAESWGGVMTISVDEDINRTSSINNRHIINFNVLGYFMQHLLMFCCLFTSSLLTFTSMIILHVYSNKMTTTGHKIFQLVQYVGLYSFTGGIASLISFKLAFHPKLLISHRMRKTKKMKSFLRKYLLKEVFDSPFLKQFLRRMESVQQTDNSMMVACIDSVAFNDWILKRFRSIHVSPEGIILDSLGIKETELQTYFKVLMTDCMLEFQKMFGKNKKEDSMLDPHRMSKYVDNITLEKFSNISTDAEFRVMLNEIVGLQLDNIICYVTVTMAVFGMIVGCIQIYA